MGEHLHTPAFVAWYGLLQVQSRTFDLMARELEAQTGLSASWYELLACLESAPDGHRMNELAEDLLISRGGATKLVARMEDAGLVERYTPKDDRRATFARLTDAGRERIAAAHPVQLELSQEYFGQYLSEDELAGVVSMSIKVLNGIGAECDWLSAVEAHDRVLRGGQADAPAVAESA